MRRLAPCWLALLLAGCDSAGSSREAPPQSPPPAVEAPAAAAPSPMIEDSAPPPIAPPPIARVDTASVPVQVGGEAEFDACGGLGEIVTAVDGGSAVAEVRRGPGQRFAVVDRLRAGHQVWLCDGSDADGGWSGIVFSETGEVGCDEVASPIAERQPYRGSCKSGWIRSGAIKVTAG